MHNLSKPDLPQTQSATSSAAMRPPVPRMAFMVASANQSEGRYPIDTEIDDFICARQVQRVTESTIRWHKKCLKKWRSFCLSQHVHATEQTTPRLLRAFVIHLEAVGHNAGGIANYYSSVKAFLLWYEEEYEPSGWKSPSRKVKVRVPRDAPLEPVDVGHVQAMLAACDCGTLQGDRDFAMLCLLLDSGLRQQELTDLRVDDVDLPSGMVTVRRGKGGKFRTVFVGANTRQALARYLQHRGQLSPNAPLWIGRDGQPLRRDGIRQVVRRRAKDANIPRPGLHAFRRAFAINSLRNGMDVVTLQRLMGHTTLDVTTRYLKLVVDDLRVAQARYGVVDHL